VSNLGVTKNQVLRFAYMTIQSEVGNAVKTIKKALQELQYTRQRRPIKQFANTRSVSENSWWGMQFVAAQMVIPVLRANPALGYVLILLVRPCAQPFSLKTLKMYWARHYLTRRAVTKDVAQKNSSTEFIGGKTICARNGGEMDNIQVR